MTDKPGRRRRRAVAIALGIVVVTIVVGSIAGIKFLQFDAMATAASQMQVPPEPVNVIEVRAEEWRPRITAVGSIAAVQGTVVSAEAEGVVRNIPFEAGSVVEADAVLVELDDDIEQAQLRADEASAEWARQSFARAQNLLAENSISREEFDAAEANLKQTEAQVDNIRAVIAKKVVRAPFAGQLGIRRISVGQYLEKGSPIVSLHSLDPVYVEFSLPQQQLAHLREGLSVLVSSDAWPGVAYQGSITAIEPNIDPATRNVRLQATLANPDGSLRSGMFVSVEVVTARSEEVLVVPSTAVVHAPFGDSLFVVEENGSNDEPNLTVRQQPVRLGARQGDFVVAVEGVEQGDTVVSTGVFKLRPGMPVVIDNTLAPQFRKSPDPDNS